MKIAKTVNKMKKLLVRPVLTRILLASVLMLSVQTSWAASATWLSLPMDSDWSNPANWTSGGPPNGPSDTATFSFSTGTDVSIYADTEVDGITFDTAASPYTITVTYPNGVLTMSGAGIVNNSGVTQNLIIGSNLFFINNATAGDANLTVSQYTEFDGNSTAASATFSVPNGNIVFNDATNAGNATFDVDGFIYCGSGAGSLGFYGTASADNAVFTLNGGAICGSGGGGFAYFGVNSTAANSTFNINGGSNSGELGGVLVFQGDYTGNSPSAGNATFIVNGGTNGGTGGSVQFLGYSLGGTPRMEVFNNGNLDISAHVDQNFVPTPVIIGSLEGTGAVFLGASNLTVGSNNLSTTFSGTIQDQGGINTRTGGSLTKIGRGKLTLSGANTYTGGTTVAQGSLLVTNRTGSATGAGAVTVNGGIFGGTGKVSGPVTIGSARKAGTLAPGSGRNPGRLTTTSSLTFNARGLYQVDLNSTRGTADQISANGVTIASGATITVTDSSTTVLPSGTAFVIVNNTGTMPIVGTFSNLPDGSTLTVGSNIYLVSYEGGTGNDLTLTVQ